MQILIPMAGAGSRFVKEGYTIPKPLIDVSGKPMILQALNCLPMAEKNIFVLRKEDEEQIAPTLKSNFKNTQIISIDYLTEGQASTCLLAKNYLELEKPLIVGACDNGMIYDKNKVNEMLNNLQIDSAIFTFRNNITVTRNPKMYGWVKTINEKVLEVKCKQPISENPINDHALVGCFYFRKAKFMIDAIEKMIQKNIRINNEFYLDTAINELVILNRHVTIFEIDKYICWGTPNDLKTYQYWENYFKC